MRKILVSVSIGFSLTLATDVLQAQDKDKWADTWAVGSDGSGVSSTKGKVIFKKDFGEKGTLVLRQIDTSATMSPKSRIVIYHLFVEKTGEKPLLRLESFFEDPQPVDSKEEPDIAIVDIGLTNDDAIVVVELSKNDNWYRAQVLAPPISSEDKAKNDLVHWSRHWHRELRQTTPDEEHPSVRIEGNLFDKSLTIALTKQKTNVVEKWGLGYEPGIAEFGWVRLSSLATKSMNAPTTQSR